jgi:hypothetical protein
MPNHVTNRLIFANEADYKQVFDLCCKEVGSFDFSALVPPPPNMYRGDLSSTDEKDFPINWLTWSRENWGTKWNGYGSTVGQCEAGLFIQFDTAWAPPYPIMAAIANKFGCAFEHRYRDEGENFWGVDTWSGESRLEKRLDDPADLPVLRKEFGCDE